MEEVEAEDEVEDEIEETLDNEEEVADEDEAVIVLVGEEVELELVVELIVVSAGRVIT